jgi:hypothetical protein
MAIVNATHVRRVRGLLEVTWPNMLNGDTGLPFQDGADFGDKTITVRGTFGAAGSVSLRGTDSADATAVTGWDILNDSRGGANPITFTARGTKVVLENPDRIAPHVTAGDGTTSLTVVLACRRGKAV